MNRRSLVWLLAIVLLGLALRLYQLDAVPLRGDEAFSAQNWAGRPLADSLATIATIEPHPPLTYASFRLWGRLVGIDAVFALRLFSVLTNVLGIPALYALGKRLSGSARVGLLAALLWAVHPYQVWHAQDFRNYAAWAGFSAVTVWLGLRVLQTRHRADWALYALVALGTSLLFYMELVTIGVLGVYAWLRHWREPRFLLRWSVLNAGLVAVIGGMFAVLQGALVTGGGYGGTTGTFQAEKLLTWFLPTLSFGNTVPNMPLVGLFVAAALFVALLALWQQNMHTGLFLLLLGFLPMLVLALASTRMNIFTPRYILNAAPAYTLLIAGIALMAFRRPWLRRGSRLLLALWLLIAGVSLNNHYHNPLFRKSPDWPVLAQYLRDNTTADDVVIQTGADAAFGYYYKQFGITTDEFALPFEPEQPEQAILRILEETQPQYESLWIVGQTFPDWPNAGVVEDWALETMQLVRATRAANLPVRQFMPWEVAPAEYDAAPLADFGGIVELLDSRIYEPEPTNALTIWLYWQPQQTSEQSLTIFVHLIGAPNPATGSPLWTQDDHQPLGGRITTTSWQPDEVFRDVAVLDFAGVPAGEYEIRVGIYDPGSGERLLTAGNRDFYTVGTISIQE